MSRDRINWFNRDLKMARQIMRTVIQQVQAGVPERPSCERVTDLFTESTSQAEALYRAYLQVKRRMQLRGKWVLPPKVRFRQKCLYCGVSTGKMIPVCDFRGEIVGAHPNCERLEQAVAAGL
jgi:hypothetical protein